MIGRRRALFLATAAVGMVTALVPMNAAAQSAPSGSPPSAPPEAPPVLTTDQVTQTRPTEATSEGADVVVTGTLIRGIAPAGNNVVGITREQVAASGATTSNQILGSLPQVGNFFNALPAGVSPVSGSNNSIPISRPNLRTLPASQTSGGAQTLVLIDGHRVVGAGIQQVAVDPDIIAPGVVERVEALTDGGSAVYGSDALGGVINFITRRKFNGILASGRGGFGDRYRSQDASLMAGRDWGSGGLYVAYGFSRHDAVFGIDRANVRLINWTTGVPTGRNCPLPNVTVGTGAAVTGYVASGSGIVAGGPNVCDLSDPQAIYPATELHTVYAHFVQDLTSWIHVDISALYAHRGTGGTGGTLGTGTLGSGAAGQAVLTAASANYRNPGSVQAGQSETVTFDYSPLFGVRSASQRNTLESYSVDPTVAVDLGHGFQARGLFSYGHAFTAYRNAQISAAAQAAGLAAGTINPFNIGATSSGVAAGLLQYARGTGRNELFDYRAIIDGPLFDLGGGAVRVAAGYERMVDVFQARSTNATTYVFQTPTNYTQRVNSVFGELQVPLVSSANAMTLLHELTLSGSARYDSYSDFGHTFNPKGGVTWRPISWVAIRGNIGKSFNAPTPVDELGVASSTVAVVPAQFLTAAPPGTTTQPGEVGVFVAGTAPGIGPQTATNWSAGGEVKPPVIDGLTISGSFYHIDLRGTIGRPISSADLNPFYAGFPNLYSARPSGQALAAYIAQFNPANVSFVVSNPTSTAQALITGAGQVNAPVLVTLDTRGRNLGHSTLSGLDFAANYVRPTGFGSVDATFSGNYRLTQRTQSNPTALVTNDLFLQNVPRLLFQASVGATLGTFRAEAMLNHTAGYTRGDAYVLNALNQPTATPNPAAFGQTAVSAFNSVNLFFRYGVPKRLVGPGLELTINVNNLIDADTPTFKSAALPGYNTAGGQALTIGRVVQFGVTKKF